MIASGASQETEEVDLEDFGDEELDYFDGDEDELDEYFDEDKKERIKKSQFYKKPFHRIIFVSKITREWSPALNALDFRALMFVLDRTLGWRKEWEAISRKQCVEGIVDHRSGKRYSYGFISCEKRAGEVLKRLVERGVLKRRKKFKNWAGFEYSINRDFDPSPFIPERFTNDLKRSEGGFTSEAGAVSQGGGERNRPEEGCETTPTKTKKEIPKTKKDREEKTSDVSSKRSSSEKGARNKKSASSQTRSTAFRRRSRKRSV